MTKHVRRRKAIAAVTAAGAVLALGLSFTSAAGAAPADASAASAAPGNLKLIKTKTSLLGKHYWYQQTFKGLPVLNGYYAKHVDKSGKVVQVVGRARRRTGEPRREREGAIGNRHQVGQCRGHQPRRAEP